MSDEIRAAIGICIQKYPQYAERFARFLNDAGVERLRESLERFDLRVKLLESGFTGVKTYSNGAKHYYRDGVHIVGPMAEERAEIEAIQNAKLARQEHTGEHTSPSDAADHYNRAIDHVHKRLLSGEIDTATANAEVREHLAKAIERVRGVASKQWQEMVASVIGEYGESVRGMLEYKKAEIHREIKEFEALAAKRADDVLVRGARKARDTNKWPIFDATTEIERAIHKVPKSVKFWVDHEKQVAANKVKESVEALFESVEKVAVDAIFTSSPDESAPVE